MGKDKTAKKNIKPLIIALSVLLVIVSAFLVTSAVLGKGFLSKDGKDSETYAEEEELNSEEMTTQLTSSTTMSQTALTEDSKESDKKTDKESDKKSDEKSEKSEKTVEPETKDFSKNISTTIKQKNLYKNDDGLLPAGSTSRLLKDSVATHRWTASNVISNVTAERIAVNLNVYKDGVKTDKIVKRYIYAAVINTKPSRIVIPAASQYTDKKLAAMENFVKAYEKSTKEDILFAATNEMCSRDYDNIKGNVFYNGGSAITGTVIKAGRVAQAGDVCDSSLVINKDGTWEYPVKVSMSTANSLISKGTIASVSYTYPVIWHGSKYKHPEAGENTGIWTDHYIADDEERLYDNRTLIGKINNNKYVVLMSEGFGYGYLAECMLDGFGVQDAYWGNGGIAAAMYIKGHGLITPNNYVAHGDMFCVK